MKVEQVSSLPPPDSEISLPPCSRSVSPLTTLVLRAHVAAVSGAIETDPTNQAIEALERFCRSSLFKSHPHMSPDDRDDVIQTSLLKVWSSLRSFDPNAHAEPWISRIVGNTAIDFWRRKKNEVSLSTTPLDQFEDSSFEFSDKGTQEPHLSVIQAESEAHAAKVKGELLAKLTPEIRTTIEFKLSGLGPIQIAEKQGIPLNTVKSRLRKARIDLEEALKPALHL